MTTVPTITADQLKRKLDAHEDFMLLDVRTPGEFARGKIHNSVNLAVDQIRTQAEKLIPDKNKTIYVYCFSGSRSTEAVDTMIDLGYQNVFNVQSGILAWRANQYPLEA